MQLAHGQTEALLSLITSMLKNYFRYKHYYDHVVQRGNPRPISTGFNDILLGVYETVIAQNNWTRTDLHACHSLNSLSPRNRTYLVLLILTRVRKTRNNCRNATRWRYLTSVDHNQEFHQVVVHFPAARLHNVHVLPTDGLANFNAAQYNNNLNLRLIFLEKYFSIDWFVSYLSLRLKWKMSCG